MLGHYALLHRLNESACVRLDRRMRERFRAAFEVDPVSATLLGGAEFLRRFPNVSPSALELIWENLAQHRLGGGVSCASLQIGDARIFLVNGFTPALMCSYTHPQSAIVVFALSGSLSWKDARSRFVGAPDPARAQPGSVRHELLAHRKTLRLPDVRLGANGAHLSAGPVEALLELRRFREAVLPESAPGAREFQFGRRLARLFSEQEVSALLANPVVALGPSEQSVFAWTEEQDEERALELLGSLRDQLRSRAQPWVSNLRRDGRGATQERTLHCHA
jgi:hypothetical protein